MADTNSMKFNTNKFNLLRYGKEQKINLHIDDKEQVRDLGIMMSNTATFTLHIRNIVKKGGGQDGMGVESVSVTEALSQADTLEISCHSPTRVLLPALESMESKTDTSYRRTFTYKITEVQHLNYWERLHELKLYSLQRRRERYIIIYISKITQHMVPNIDGTMGQK